MARYLVIGDPHFREGCVREMELFSEEILKIVRENLPRIDQIVVLGDVMDRHGILHQKPFHQSCKFLIDLSTLKPTYCLIGNHDFESPAKYLPDNHPYKVMVWKKTDNLTIVEKPTLVHNTLLCPYVPPGEFARAVSEVTGKKTETPWTDLMDIGVGLVFAHQEFRGCQMGRLKSEGGDVWGEGEAPFVISGHIHDYQMVGKNILYTGTPIQVNYGEGKKRGVCLFDFEFDAKGMPLSRRETWFEIRVPRKIVKTVPLGELDTWVQKRYSQLVERYGLDIQRRRARSKEGFETIYELHTNRPHLTPLAEAIEGDRYLDHLRLQVAAEGESLPVAKLIVGKLKAIPLGIKGVFVQETERNAERVRHFEPAKNWMDLLQKRVEGDEDACRLLTEIVREMA